MITFALAAALSSLAPREVTDHLTLASMFKNGYAVIVREIDVPGSGQFVLNHLPTASLGTLWFTTSQNAQLTSVTNTMTETESSIGVQSVADLLAVNIGKNVTLVMNDPKDNITGKLEVVTGNLVLIRNGSQSIAIERAAIRRVISDETLATTQGSKSLTRGLRFDVESPGAGKIFMISLERGMAWAPGYAVTLVDDKKLRIVGKATAINDLQDIEGVETRFITGFPNMPFAGVPDPLTMSGSLDEFLGIIGGVGAPRYRDAGGFGGGRAGEMMKNQAPAMSSFDGDFGSSMQQSDLGGMQAEDLFFYRQPKVTLKKGERAYYVLFTTEAEYNELYTWDIDDFVADATYRPLRTGTIEDVWHILQFKNTAKQPFSTGAATIFKNDQMIGQDMMRYASVGGKAELRITKAVDVTSDQVEEETSRERGVLKDKYNTATHDLVTLKGTLTMQNHKNEEVTVRVRKQLTGEVISTLPEAKVVKTARGLRDVNSGAAIEWTQKIAPGKTLTLTYNYKVYIRV